MPASDPLLLLAKHMLGEPGGDADPFHLNITGPQVVGGPEPAQISLAQAQAQLPLREAAPGLEADPHAPSYQPPVIPGLRSVVGTLGGATMAPTAAALGSLLDAPGQLGRAGLAAWEALKKVPGSVFQKHEQQDFSSPTKELAKRGVTVDPISGLMADLTLDPGNFLGGEGAVSDLGKLGVMGAMAIPGGVNKLRAAVEAAKAAPTVEKALATLAGRYPEMAKALATHTPEVTLTGANRSMASAFDKLATDIHDRTLVLPGTTTYPLSGRVELPFEGNTGVMMGKYSNQSGNTKAIPLADFTPKDVKAYLEQHADTFAQHPDLALGTWIDTDASGKKIVYLDVAQKHETPRQAVMNAVQQSQPKGSAVRKGGKWEMPQIAGFNLADAENVPVGNLAEFLNSPEFQQRLDEMYQKGVPVMNGKEWWNLYGGPLERVYGKERVAPLAAMLASTSPASAPVHNLRAASEYLRRLIKNEPILQEGFRIPETAVGHLKTSMGAMTPGDFNAPGTRMPMETTRGPNLQRAAAGDYAGLQKDKVNDMFHALTGHDVGVYDRRYAKLAEDWPRGIYVDATKDKVPGTMGSKSVSPYALIENAVRTGAKRHNMPLGRFSAYVWEGIGDTIKKTGQLYGMKHPSHTIPDASQGFAGIFEAMIAEKAKAWGITVAEMEKRLRNGDAELLTALLGTPVGMVAYQLWQQQPQARSNEM
jgi:hypothetical protein